MACGAGEGVPRRGGPDEAGLIRFAYRPFDNRWLYWEKDTKLLDEKRADYQPHVFEGNLWLEAREREAKEEFSRGTLVRSMADNVGNGLSSYFPLWLRGVDFTDEDHDARCPNLSVMAQRYLDRLGVLHDLAYRKANAGALRMEWPRIPLPGWPDGEAEGTADALAKSAARGRKLAALLGPDTPAPGVTQAPLRSEVAMIAVPATIGGHNMAVEDLAVTAGWDHYGPTDAMMPGQGRIVEHAYTPGERAAMGNTVANFGATTFDTYLNVNALWRNVPATVWRYKLGGYQMLKEVAIVPRTGLARSATSARGNPVFHRQRAADYGSIEHAESKDRRMNENPICPIWSTPASELPSERDGRLVDSPRAGGKYFVSGTAVAVLEGCDDHLKVQLTNWLVEQRRLGNNCPKIITNTIDDAKQSRDPHVFDRADRILIYLARISETLGTQIGYRIFTNSYYDGQLDNQDTVYFNLLAHSGCIGDQDFLFIVDYLKRRGLIENSGRHNPEQSCALTVDGYARLAELEDTYAAAARAFVAMWFDDSMSEVWEHGFKPAINQAGYEVVRSDQTEHVNKIDDEIIAEIRRSRFVVADFTHGDSGARGGVYYEAGFAHGLNIPVIFSCRDNVIEKIHFDTRQYNHIVWKTVDELRTKLVNRIAAVIGDGPYKRPS